MVLLANFDIGKVLYYLGPLVGLIFIQVRNILNKEFGMSITSSAGTFYSVYCNSTQWGCCILYNVR